MMYFILQFKLLSDLATQKISSQFSPAGVKLFVLCIDAWSGGEAVGQ